MPDSSRYRFLYAGRFSGAVFVQPHQHEGVELVLVTEGRCETDFHGNGVLPATAGQLYVTPPRLRHSQRSTPSCQTLFAVVMVDDPEFDDSLRVVDTGSDTILRRWFCDLIELYDQNTLESTAPLFAAVWERVTALETDRGNDLRHPALARAVAYLNANFMEECPVSQLARRAGVSTSHLNLLFRQQFGFGPQHYLSKLRLNRARQLLPNPYWSIAEIAGKTGFRDPNYFSRKFREHYGVPPGECRRTLLGNGQIDC